jgi:uncharacterized protein
MSNLDSGTRNGNGDGNGSDMDPLAVMRTVYERVAAGNIPGVLALMADDVVVTQAASLPFGGTWRGRQGFIDMATRIVGAWPGFAVEPLAFLSDGRERVVVWARLKGQGLDMEMMEMWVVRSGLVTACQPFYFDTAAASAGLARHP